MKVLEPTVTVMLASHMKPRWLPSTLDSVLTQTRLDIEIVVADSGAWLRDGDLRVDSMHGVYQRYEGHPLVTWVTLDQRWPTPLRERACPYTYVWNRIIDAGLVRGKYVAVFTDDDLYRPEFIEKMAGFLDENPDELAVHCAQDQVRYVSEHEPWAPVRTLDADRPRLPGEMLDQVDMTQVMFRREVFDGLRFDENPADQACRRADGHFLEGVAYRAGVVANIPEVLVTHRYTPDSTYN